MKVVSLLLCIPVSLHAFLPRTLDAKYRGRFELRAEDGVNLSPLENIAEDASWLGESVRNWLDKEYIDLAIHSDIGERVKGVYESGRGNGVNDLGEMLMTMGSSFETFNMKDAFVGPWDVANKVSDLLILRMNRELCECSMTPDISPSSSPIATNGQKVADRFPIESHARVSSKVIFEASKDLADGFKRYRLVKDFLDCEVGWSDLNPLIALCLGFRASSPTSSLSQDPKLTPPNWRLLDDLPDFSDISDQTLENKIMRDMPEDAESAGTLVDVLYIFMIPSLSRKNYLDLVLEQLVGIEMLKILRLDGDVDMNRRLLVGKWLYIRGAFDDIFPHKTLFVPGHLRDEDDD